MKHAYLIIAHNEPEVLRRLVKSVDDKRNDIYIHIDKKANFDGSNLIVQKSNLYIYRKIDARWGDFSLVEVELYLMEQALIHGNYTYLHLLSGVDYPIKSQNYIHEYCQEHQGTEFIGFSQNVDDRELKWRSQHYFLFSRDFRCTNPLKKLIRGMYARLQSLIGFHRSSLSVKKGCQWCSITSDFCRFVLSQKEMLYADFSHTYCPDELVLQTICWNSDFRNKLYSITDEFKGCKRYIPWSNGVLRPFIFEDFMKMKDCECWFARKCSTNDINIIESL